MAGFKHFIIIAIVAVCAAAFVLNISNNTKNKATAELPNSTNLPVQNNTILEDSIPKQAGYVNDFENIYTNEEEKKLNNLLGNFEKSTQIEIALVTITTSMTTKEGLDAHTLQIANQWNVGANKNITEKNIERGITIGISKGYRKMRISNSYGIREILTDEETQETIDNTFIPQFKKGDYFEGTQAGLKSLMDKLMENLRK